MYQNRGKVAIITFHSAHNYGAMLQAYALQCTLREYGYYTKIINYRPRRIDNNYRLFKTHISPKEALKSLIILFKYYSELKMRFSEFERFMKENFQLTSVFSDGDNLSILNSEFDCFICGSDQIWNTELIDDDNYYLKFCSPEKRVSYAPSFGRSYIDEEKSNSLKERIAGIRALSVREVHGQNIIKKLTGRDSTVVLDPTMLLTIKKWKELIGDPIIKTPYNLTYFLDQNPLNKKLIDKIKEQNGYPVIGMTPFIVNRDGIDKLVLNQGPLGFLNLIYYAETICCSSFHGAVFSIMFNKVFYTIAHRTRNSRIINLLELVKLESRMIETPEDLNSVNITAKIDYTSVDNKIGKEREKSLSFLYESVDGAVINARGNRKCI